MKLHALHSLIIQIGIDECPVAVRHKLIGIIRTGLTGKALAEFHRVLVKNLERLPSAAQRNLFSGFQKSIQHCHFQNHAGSEEHGNDNYACNEHRFDTESHRALLSVSTSK